MSKLFHQILQIFYKNFVVFVERWNPAELVIAFLVKSCIIIHGLGFLKQIRNMEEKK